MTSVLFHSPWIVFMAHLGWRDWNVCPLFGPVLTDNVNICAVADSLKWLLSSQMLRSAVGYCDRGTLSTHNSDKTRRPRLLVSAGQPRTPTRPCLPSPALHLWGHNSGSPSRPYLHAGPGLCCLWWSPCFLIVSPSILDTSSRNAERPPEATGQCSQQ